MNVVEKTRKIKFSSQPVTSVLTKPWASNGVPPFPSRFTAVDTSFGLGPCTASPSILTCPCHRSGCALQSLGEFSSGLAVGCLQGKCRDGKTGFRKIGYSWTLLWVYSLGNCGYCCYSWKDSLILTLKAWEIFLIYFFNLKKVQSIIWSLWTFKLIIICGN